MSELLVVYYCPLKLNYVNFLGYTSWCSFGIANQHVCADVIARSVKKKKVALSYSMKKRTKAVWDNTGQHCLILIPAERESRFLELSACKRTQ